MIEVLVALALCSRDSPGPESCSGRASSTSASPAAAGPRFASQALSPRSCARSIAMRAPRSHPTRRDPRLDDGRTRSAARGQRCAVDVEMAVPARYRITIEWPVAGLGMQRLVLPVTT